jgi:hypothetical protein
VTLPGVGSLSFSVDPTTHDLTGLMVTPADPSIVAGTPVLTDEGVQVLFTSPTGAETLEVEVEGDGAVPVVKAEAQGPSDAMDAAGNGTVPTGDEDGNNNGAGDNENKPGVTNNEPGENEGTPPPTSTTTRSEDGSPGGSDDGMPTTTPTAPSMPTTTTSSGDSGGSDGGNISDGDRGSGSGSSSDGNGSDG